MRRLIALLLAITLLLAVSGPAYAITPNEALGRAYYQEEGLRQFDNTLQLDYFLSTYNGNKVLALYQVYLKKDIDCDDYAFRLRDDARLKGYDIETEGFNKGEYNGREYMKKAHLMCKAFIGNDVILIDPVTLEYWSWWQID